MIRAQDAKDDKHTKFAGLKKKRHSRSGHHNCDGWAHSLGTAKGKGGITLTPNIRKYAYKQAVSALVADLSNHCEILGEEEIQVQQMVTTYFWQDTLAFRKRNGSKM